MPVVLRVIGFRFWFYSAERAEPPLDSKIAFTPADFCIGDSGIRFFSRRWENACEQPPVEFIDERNVIREPQ